MMNHIRTNQSRVIINVQGGYKLISRIFCKCLSTLHFQKKTRETNDKLTQNVTKIKKNRQIDFLVITLF